MSPSDFTLHDGERVIRFGADARAEAATLATAQGLDGYALLTTERALETAPAEVRDQAEVVLLVPPGPVPEAAAAVRAAVAGRPLLAFGGGRVVDAAKSIGSVEGLDVGAVPTTLAGSPFTPFHRLPAGVGGYGWLRPVLAVCDPVLMASAPMPGLAATAMNALAHAVESLYAPGANPVSEGAALRAAALFARGLPVDRPDAGDLSLAAVLAGWAVGTAGLGVHHAVCQTIVREKATPHAQTNAVMLPHSVAFMADRAPSAIGRLAVALAAGAASAGPLPFGDVEAEAPNDPAAASSRVAELAALAGPRSLAELGVGRANLTAIVAAASGHPGVAATPGKVTEADLRGLLERAL